MKHVHHHLRLASDTRPHGLSQAPDSLTPWQAAWITVAWLVILIGIPAAFWGLG